MKSTVDLRLCDHRRVIQQIEGKSGYTVITDPPYNIGFPYDKYQDSLSDDEYIEMISQFQYPFRTVMIQYPENFFKWLCPSLGNPNAVSAWCYNQNIPHRFRLIGYWGCFPDYSRIRQSYKNGTDKRIEKLMNNGSGGGELYEWWDDIQIVKNWSAEKTEHPCPIPLKLAKRLIVLTTNPGDTVIDPFMGSGTVGVACVMLNRNFIGTEISPQYFEIAQQRILAAQSQMQMDFDAESDLKIPEHHTQENLF